MTRQFARTCVSGDLPGLLALLNEDITLWSDGGGKAAAALNPVYGRDNVARFFVGAVRKFGANLEVEFTEVNGQPGIITFEAGVPTGVLTFDIVDDRIAAIRAVRNPDKLEAIARMKPRIHVDERG